MRYLMIMLLFSAFTTFAATPKNIAPLFASVTGVADNDVLNVRSHPDYRAPKVGSIPPETVIGIHECRKIGHSRWCRIHSIAQNGYDGKPGWVNARFLKPRNRGYVLIDGKGSCDYALSCNNGRCDVITEVMMDDLHHATRLIHQTIPRSRLRASSIFEAMGDDNPEGDYCIRHRLIDEYLHQNTQSTSVNPQTLTRRVVQWIHTDNIDALAKAIHPIRSVRLSWQTDFRQPRSHTFSRDQLLTAYRSHKKVDWGADTAKGDPIRMDLKRFFRSLTRDPARITKLLTCNYRGFTARHANPMACIEAKWINPHSQTRDYDWLGLVVVMERYRGKWYVVGLLHDRWEI